MANQKSKNYSNIESISNFIEVANQKGIPDDTIYKLLKNQGWSNQDVELVNNSM